MIVLTKVSLTRLLDGHRGLRCLHQPLVRSGQEHSASTLPKSLVGSTCSKFCTIWKGTPENRIRRSKGVSMRDGGQRSISFHTGREEIVSRAFASWDSVYGRMCIQAK